MSAVIEMRGVTKKYTRGGETVTVLHALNLDVPAGDFVALMGPSGSGKTTILNLAGGLDSPDAGSLNVAGTEIASRSPSALAAWRAKNVGFVFQSFNLIPVLTALENVMLPLLLTPLSRAERRKHALHALDIVGLSDRVQHRPRQLSGGQEQRVAIARAIASDPGLLLADEPTGDLDRNSADAVLDLLRRLNRELGKTIVMVTHDQVAPDRANRVLHLDKGLLREQVINAPPLGKPEAQPGSGGPR